MPLSICKRNKRNKLIKKNSATKKTDFPLDSACRAGCSRRLTHRTIPHRRVAHHCINFTRSFAHCPLDIPTPFQRYIFSND